MTGEAFALSFFDPDRELYGIARSGSTISMGLFLGYERQAAKQLAELQLEALERS